MFVVECTVYMNLNNMRVEASHGSPNFITFYGFINIITKRPKFLKVILGMVPKSTVRNKKLNNFCCVSCVLANIL